MYAGVNVRTAPRGACVCARNAFGRAWSEYLNNSLINIRERFIGFEAYSPFVGKH